MRSHCSSTSTTVAGSCVSAFASLTTPWDGTMLSLEPGIIGAIVSWLLKTAGSVAVWLAEHLWALALALVAAAAVYMRDYRATK